MIFWDKLPFGICMMAFDACNERSCSSRIFLLLLFDSRSMARIFVKYCVFRKRKSQFSFSTFESLDFKSFQMIITQKYICILIKISLKYENFKFYPLFVDRNRPWV